MSSHFEIVLHVRANLTYSAGVKERFSLVGHVKSRIAIEPFTQPIVNGDSR